MSGKSVLFAAVGNRKSRVRYTLRDDFTDTRSAGAVSGTAATPIGGTRSVTDTNSKVTVSGLALNVATGSAAGTICSYDYQTRVPGRAVITRHVPGGGSGGGGVVGWQAEALNFRTNGALLRILYNNAGGLIAAGSFTDAHCYHTASVLRSVGCLQFVRGGTEYPKWTLVYPTILSSTSPLAPAIQPASTLSVFSAHAIRVPSNLIKVFSIASDSFDRANGALGSTDGAGVSEGGGGGKAWTVRSGAWAISSNKAIATSLGVATVDIGTADVVCEAAVTWTAANVGVVVRYVDVNNYIMCLYNGTNAIVYKVIGGVANYVISQAITYAAGARLVVVMSGTKLRVYYNDVLVSAEQTIADSILQSGTICGLYSDPGNTMDNFATWARGTGGEYESTFNKYLPSDPLLVFDGDSLTLGSGSSDIYHTYPAILTAALNLRYLNYGTGGASIANLLSDVTTQVDVEYFANRNNVLFLWAGANAQAVAPATTYADIVSYHTGRRAVGFKTVAFTIIPRADGAENETNRAAVNASIRANWATFANALCDVAADARLQTPTNATYFNADKVHLTDAGYAVVAELALSAYAAIV